MAFKRFNEPVDLGRPIAEVEEIALTHRDDFISFTFAALDFRAPEKNRYAYQLEGFDDRWVEAGSRREATYTNLDPGNYVFRVKAANNDGVWNPEGISVRIAIRPPFWGTWWFRMLALAIVRRHPSDASSVSDRPRPASPERTLRARTDRRARRADPPS